MAWASRIWLLYYYLPDIIRGFATIFRAADSSIAITYNNFTRRKDSKDLIQFPTPAFKNTKHLPSMGRIIARWMTHTVTFRGRAMNQIFIILPAGKRGSSIYVLAMEESVTLKKMKSYFRIQEDSNKIAVLQRIICLVFSQAALLHWPKSIFFVKALIKCLNNTADLILSFCSKFIHCRW